MIVLSDNNIAVEASLKTFSYDEVKDLLPIGNKPLKDVCADNPNLLVFPHSLYETSDVLGEASIFDFSFSQSQEEVCLTTGNVMGFVGKGNQSLCIRSRFDSGRNDYFLHYMLQRVFPVNLFALNHTSTTESVFDILMFMLPYYLKRAMKQGVYRKYTHFKYNDSNIRGTIDISRHIRQNIPFQGNVAYSTREYSCDNSMTQLIRHTIEYVRTRQFGDVILNMDEDTIGYVSAICQCTPSYNRGARAQIVEKNLRAASHPYYMEYLPLQKLCLKILRLEEIKYGESEDEFFGLLFDGAWLWEEYCNTILSKHGFLHPQNKIGQGRIYLFENHRAPRFPDFYKDDYVIDAKYKTIGDADHPARAQVADLHQLIAYMFRLKAQRGAFISPLTEERRTVACGELLGYGGHISILGIQIPKTNDSYERFCKQMKETEAEIERCVVEENC